MFGPCCKLERIDNDGWMVAQQGVVLKMRKSFGS